MESEKTIQYLRKNRTFIIQTKEVLPSSKQEICVKIFKFQEKVAQFQRRKSQIAITD